MYVVYSVNGDKYRHDKYLTTQYDSDILSGKHVKIMYIPYFLYTPILYYKIGLYRGIHFFFLILDPKHRLWVLIRTASGKLLQGVLVGICQQRRIM